MSLIIKNPYKGKNDTPVGIMPPDQFIKHKLSINASGDASYRKVYRRNRKVKYLFQLVKHYRQMVHGVHENRLASPLRLACHYLLEPMSKSYSNDSNSSNNG